MTTQPTINLYGRVTQRGIRKMKTKRGKDMIRFTLAVQIEPTEATTQKGEPLTDPAHKRYRPLYVTCICGHTRPYRIAERLTAHMYAAVVGRLTRRRWYNTETGAEHDEYTVYADAISAMIPGSHIPMDWDEPKTAETQTVDSPPTDADDSAPAAAAEPAPADAPVATDAPVAADAGA